jgi:dephospho-CoA kinase
VILRNGGTLGELHRQVDDLWRNRLVPYAQNLAAGAAAGPQTAAGPGEFERAAARVRLALAGADARIEEAVRPGIPETGLELTVTTGDLDAARTALAAAGWVAWRPDERGWWVGHSADPGRPAALLLKPA